MNRDVLGTFGWSSIYNIWDLTFFTELGRNFGQIYNTGAGGNGKNISHKGYMLAGKVAWNPHAWFYPSFQVFYMSGNKISGEHVTTGNTNDRQVDRDYSPGDSLANTNLDDSIAEPLLGLPMVAAGGFNSLMFGIGRPNGASGGGHVKSNLVAYNLNTSFSLIPKLLLIVDLWHMTILNPGYRLRDGQADRLDEDYGREIDVIASYPLKDYLKLGLLSGIFFPGDYHEDHVGRTDGDILEFAPITNRDDSASNAYVVQLGVQLSF